MNKTNSNYNNFFPIPKEPLDFKRQYNNQSQPKKINLITPTPLSQEKYSAYRTDIGSQATPRINFNR